MGKPAWYVPVFFAPDADQSWDTNPGVLSEVRNLVPNSRGHLENYVCGPGDASPRISPYASAEMPRSAAIVPMSSVFAPQRARFLIGTSSNLLEVNTASTGIVNNVSSAPNVYTAPQGWRFATYGNVIIATGVSEYMPTDLPQSSSVVGALFGNLAGATIRGSICLVQKGQVLLYNCYDGVDWYGDGWASSGVYNTGSWVANLNASANLATQANTGRILDAPGTIRAAEKMRDGTVVYKDDAMFIGTYTGNPFGWTHRLVSNEIGTHAPHGVAVVNGVHYFIHRTGVYRFDGSFPQNIGTGIINSFIATLLSEYQSNIYSRFIAVVNQKKNLILWYFQSNNYDVTTNGEVDCAIAYNYVSNKFGFIDRPWSDASPSTSGFGCPVVATRDAHDEYSSNLVYQPDLLTVGNLSSTIQVRHAQIGASSVTGNYTCGFTTGDLGSDVQITRLSRVKPKLARGEESLQQAALYVDGKASLSDMYSGEGLHLIATATSTAAGFAYTQMRFIGISGAFSPMYRTVLADDYIKFDLCPIAGSLATPVGVRLLFSDATTAFYTVLPTALGRPQEALVAIGASAGKIISTYYFGFSTAGAVGEHHACISNVSITDSAGVDRVRVFRGDEPIWVNRNAIVSNYTVGVSYQVGSYGNPFSYTPSRRRFDGDIADRYLRVRGELYNATELCGLTTEMVAVGTEK